MITIILAMLLAQVAFGSAAISGQDVDLLTLTSTVGFKMQGTSTGDQSGVVSNAGDVNKDGIDDILVSSQGTNRAYVIFGNGTGLIPNINFATMVAGPSVGYRINRPSTGQCRISRAGDINGDGIGDIVIGFFSSTAFVIFGKDSKAPGVVVADISLATTATFPTGASTGFRITGGTYLGASVGCAGDVNGDGVDDILLGDHYGQPPNFNGASRVQAGIVYVLFGRNVAGGTGVAPFSDVFVTSFNGAYSGGFRILGAVAYDHLGGTSVQGAGDTNGDALQDIIVGAYEASANGLTKCGESYVIFGRRSTLGAASYSDVDLAVADPKYFRIQGTVGFAYSGVSVSTAGDMNGDGVADVIVGANGATTTVGRASAGAAYVIFGRRGSGPGVSTDILLSTIVTGSSLGFRIFGANMNDNAGRSVSNAGDVNGDGVDDVIVGAPATLVTATRVNAGVVYVIFGRNITNGARALGDLDLRTIVFGSTAGFRILGAAASDACGQYISGGGDVNNDGIKDVIIGSFQGDPDTLGAGSNAGISYVIYGAISAPTSQPSSQPSGQPSSQPAARPSAQPSAQPSTRPSSQPVSRPSTQPSAQPSCQPSFQPASRPSAQPSGQPSSRPSTQPSAQPSGQPSSQPAVGPSAQPSAQPSFTPSTQPTSRPSAQPSAAPSCRPSVQPSSVPSGQPSSQPLCKPSARPSFVPSAQPTGQPSAQPSLQPASQPSGVPSSRPSSQPSKVPSGQPSGRPSSLPSSQPLSMPSSQPSSAPSAQPSSQPSLLPFTSQPSGQPTCIPSAQPSSRPRAQPRGQPSTQPSSARPSSAQTAHVSAAPTPQPSAAHNDPPVSLPSARPSPAASAAPSLGLGPSAIPTTTPSTASSGTPAQPVTQQPSIAPSTEWATFVVDTSLLRQLSVVNGLVWVCGENSYSSTSSCSLLDPLTGKLTRLYWFSVWNSIDAPAMTTTSTGGSVVVSGRAGGVDSTASEMGSCAVWDTYLFCDVKSFADARFLTASYVSYPNRIVYVGTYNVYVSATIIDVTADTVRSFIYSLFNLKSVVLSQAQSPPNFIGCLVAGTAVRSAGSAVSSIVVGLLRTDTVC